MEIEYINEDTIRVRIDNSDLVERGVTFLDLLGSQSQIESFFYSILEEVDVDEEFKNTDAVTFQVMPKNNGLELFISKGNQYQEELLEDLDDDAFKTMKDLGGAIEEIRDEKAAEEESESNQTKEWKKKTPPSAKQVDLVLKFSNIEQVILMAQEYQMKGQSSLYVYKEFYYLSLKYDDLSAYNQDHIDLYLSQALEYGVKDRISTEVLEEYAEVIQKDNALEVFRQHFG